GSLYVSDLGDSYPGSVILKSTPFLYSPFPGPGSIMDGQQSYGPKICCRDTEEGEEEEEEEPECVEVAQDFLNSLPSPMDYRQWLLDTYGLIGYLCNYHPVTVWHYTFVTCTTVGAGPCCEPGCSGKCCVGAGIWCEEYIFATCVAARTFYLSIEPEACVSHPTATVGMPSIFSVNGPSGDCSGDDYCKSLGKLLYEDRMTPVAYTAGYPGDNSCGEDDNDGNGLPDRRPAPDDAAWIDYVC
ncbi:MAG: hypothetical protein ACFFG0_15260, partial [Candidatus Thorarchaeota archaeon]